MSEWRHDAEIVIIGGGIMGLCTSYYLAKQNQKGVILLEKDLLAQASTGLCVGGIRQQFSHPSNILLSQETVRLFEHFEEEFQAGIGFQQVGYLFLAQKDKTWDDFLASHTVQRSYGVPVELLTPDEIKYRWPYLKVDDLKGGSFCPEDGYADPYSVAMAFARSARKLKVAIFENTKVTGIRIKNGKLSGVETPKGPISTSRAVIAAGPWAGEAVRMAGLDFPVHPFRRQVFMTKAFPEIPKPVPMILDSDTLFYFRGEGPGLLMGMSDKEEPASFNTNVDWDFLERVAQAATSRAPVLKKAGILRGWGGLYAITPDENPIIGAIPEIEGLFCAVGFSGHGFQHGPAVGRILSELILEGHTDFDLRPFRHDRFAGMEEEGEKRVI